MPKGKKSLGFSVSYQAWDRTLTEKARQRIVDRLRRELGAELCS